MPFTPSHAVVALPFLGLRSIPAARTVPAAIAIGAMTPDLPLFVRASPLRYGQTHDFASFPSTIVLALVLLVVWRCVLRPGARELSPTGLARRLPGEWDRAAAGALRDTFSVTAVRRPGRRQHWRVSVLGIVLLVLALAFGIASHIAWDQFTHEGRSGVAAIPALAEMWGPLAGYKWLQHGSSVMGLVILAVAAVLWLRRADAAPRVRRILPSWIRVAWWLSLPAALAIAWVSGLVAYGPLTDAFRTEHLAYRVLPPACAVWGVITVALCVMVQVRRR